MKNISNLDVKRHKLGLNKELSSFSILSIYKVANMKSKLEIIGLIEVIKHTEKPYFDALSLIFKLEKVKSISEIITKLSKTHLNAKILSDSERHAMSPKVNLKESVEPIKLPKFENTFFQTHKSAVLFASGILGFIFLVFLISTPTPNQNINTKTNKKEEVIRLIPEFNQKYISTIINGRITKFLLDTGASTSIVSKSYLNKCIRSGFVNRNSHYITRSSYLIANGDIVSAELWRFPSVKIGPKTIYNVEIAVMDDIDEDGFLLGMSTINKLGDATIDLANNKIIIN